MAVKNTRWHSFPSFPFSSPTKRGGFCQSPHYFLSTIFQPLHYTPWRGMKNTWNKRTSCMVWIVIKNECFFFLSFFFFLTKIDCFITYKQNKYVYFNNPQVKWYLFSHKEVIWNVCHWCLLLFFTAEICWCATCG